MKTEIAAYENAAGHTVRMFRTEIGTVLLHDDGDITVSLNSSDDSLFGASSLNFALEMIQAEYDGQDFPLIKK